MTTLAHNNIIVSFIRLLDEFLYVLVDFYNKLNKWS